MDNSKSSPNSHLTLPLLASGRKKRWSYSSLVFSLFFFVPLLLSLPLPAAYIALQACAYMVFVVVYIFAINTPVQRLPFFLTALIVVAYTTSINNPGGAIIFGFIAFIVGYYYPLKKGLTFVLVIALTLFLLQFFILDTPGFFLVAAAINTIVLFGFGAMERRETQFQLKEAEQAKTLSTLSAIAERERIGRDLHDVAGHALSSISLKAQLADKLLEKNEISLAQKEVKALAHLSQSLLSDIRHAVSDIKHLTLRDEIAKSTAILKEKNFDVAITLARDFEQHLTSMEEAQLALIIKELTTNTLRHSKGENVALSISEDNAALTLCYQDFGEPDCQTTVAEGNGITGIRERAALINATFALSCDSAASFCCTLTLPGSTKNS